MIGVMKYNDIIVKCKSKKDLLNKLIEEQPMIIDFDGTIGSTPKYILEAIAQYIVHTGKEISLPNIKEEDYIEVQDLVALNNRLTKTNSFIKSLKENQIVRVYTAEDIYFAKFKGEYSTFFLVERFKIKEGYIVGKYKTTIYKNDLKIGQVFIEDISEEDRKYLHKYNVI